MSYFSRQKRQARSYWAELGFLVLGLFALQPNMLTSLLSGSRSRSQTTLERPYPYTAQSLLAPISQPWMANSVGANYLPSYQTPSNILTQSWTPQNVGYYAAPQNPIQPTFTNSHLSSAYLAGQSAPQNGNLLPDYYVNSWGSQAAQQFPPASQNYQPTNPYGQPMGSTSAYSVLPQQPDWRNNRPSSSNSGYASNPLNSLIANPTQSALGSSSGLFNYGPDNYLSGRTNSPSNYYPYPANSTGTNSFTPYRPGNSYYR